ncbi:hypothetical protein N431DRAFT_356603 [Stipitochalara longipes BDJ]|nr:hypothetical protein N431DRAFT_356603 [Stipitochalara longipes BDJ]
MSSGTSKTKKVHYESGTRANRQRHRSRDSGVGSSSASDRASLGTAPNSSFPFDDQINVSALREALDAANEHARSLEAEKSKLMQLLTESNKENRLLKREKRELLEKLDDAADDLENERKISRRGRGKSPNSNRDRSPSASLPRSTRTRPDEKIPSSKSIDLAVISQPARFFQVGRVFKTLWTEPAGETATDTDKEYYRPVGYGQLSFTKMRRFVVVRKRLHSCLCLAISTYGGQGSAKKDFRSEDHAVVYGSKDPIPAYAESAREPIPVIIEESSESIDPKSLIDFGRVYTVEHNVKVLNVGRVPKSHKKCLDQYFTDSIGISADLEDEGYGDDAPISRPDSRTERQQANSNPWIPINNPITEGRTFNTPNPMANPFTPSMRSQSRPMSFYAQPVSYAQAPGPGPITYTPAPTTYGHFPAPRPPEGPSKYPPNDGLYHPYPI